MNTDLLPTFWEADESAEAEAILSPEALEHAATYVLKTDIRAGAPAAGCPSTYVQYKYRGTTNCVVAC